MRAPGRRVLKLLVLLGALLLGTPVLSAQTYYAGQVYGSPTQINGVPTFTLPQKNSLYVLVCLVQGASCGPAQIYQDPGLTQPITTTMYPDERGRFGFWAQTAVYEYTVVTGYGRYGPYTLPVSLGTGTGINAVGVATANGLQGTSSGGTSPTLTIGPDASHTLPVTTGSASTYLNGAGQYSMPAGATFPSAPAIVVNTSTTASRNAATTDVASLLQTASGCSTAGYVYSPSTNTCILGGALGPVVTAPAASQTVTQPVGTTLAVNSLNNVVSSNGYSSIENAIAGCNAVYPCQIVVSSRLTQATSGTYTIPSGVYIAAMAGGSIAVGSGNTLSFANSSLSGPPVAFFTGAGAVSGFRQNVDVEWFGAVGDGVQGGSTTGTNNTVPLQAAINSLSAGGIVLQAKVYDISSGLTIALSNVSVYGVSPGLNGISSLLNITNTTANGLSLYSSAGTIQWNQLKNFGIVRAVAPTGTTATGLSLDNVGGYTIDTVTVQDSIRNLYLTAAPNYSAGSIRNVNVGWGSVLAGNLYSNQTLYGVYLDSSSGAAENSVVLDNVAVANNTGANGITTYAYYLSGSALEDVDTNGLFASNVNYGIYVDYVGTGFNDTEADMHFNMPTLDNCLIACVYIGGLSYPNGLPTVSINNGYFDVDNGTGSFVDIESSEGIQVDDNMMFAPSIAGASGIHVHNSSAISVQKNHISDMLGGTYAIDVDASTDCVIAGNIVDPSVNANTPLAVGIEATNSSSKCVFSNNSIGTSSAGITVGFLLDATSQNNQFGPNVVGSGVTTPYFGFTSQVTSFPDGISAVAVSAPQGTFAGGTATNQPLVLSSASTVNTALLISNATAKSWDALVLGSGNGVNAGDFAFYDGTDSKIGMHQNNAGAFEPSDLSFGFARGASSSAAPGTQDTQMSSPSAGVVSIDTTTFGNGAGTVKSAQYLGPATAPTGSCSTNGAWVFSQDYHATVCEAGVWTTKI